MNLFALIILIVTGIVTIIGFQNPTFFDRYKFNTYAILNLKQWDRVLSSGFLHVDWMHLIFNMLTFYFFAPYLIDYLGVFIFLLIYFLSIIGGNLLSLFVYRKDMGYSAVGASGGVSGVLYAAIAVDPHIGIMIMFIPIAIPGWIFAILYLAYSIYGMKQSLGNIGHAAHLGGAFIGFIIALIAFPFALFNNTLVIILVFIPLIVLAYMIYKKR